MRDASAPLPPPGDGRLRVATWNIRKAVGLDWRRRPDRVMRVIAGLGADVLALQEADKRLGPRHAALPPDLIGPRTGMRLVPLARSSVSIGWHGNALLVGPDVAILGSDTADLPGIEPRGAVLARLGTRLGEVVVIGVHLGLRRACRRLQLHEIRAMLPGRPERAVILGDYNEWAHPHDAEAILDAHRVIRPGRSFHAARPVACLDLIAAGEDFDVAASGVQRRGEARRASDHLPVWADLAPGSAMARDGDDEDEGADRALSG